MGLYETIKIRLEAIRKLQAPMATKNYKSFVGVVNYLSMFCPNLQMLLKCIYELTRKGRPFMWPKAYQEAFEDIKARLLKPLVLHLPDNKRRFQLFSDPSKTAAGSASHQIQNDTPKSIGYSRKRLPSAVVNYSVMELKLIGICGNIDQFKHLLAKVDFDYTVDHLALTYIVI